MQVRRRLRVRCRRSLKDVAQAAVDYVHIFQHRRRSLVKVLHVRLRALEAYVSYLLRQSNGGP